MAQSSAFPPLADRPIGPYKRRPFYIRHFSCWLPYSNPFSPSISLLVGSPTWGRTGRKLRGRYRGRKEVMRKREQKKKIFFYSALANRFAPNRFQFLLLRSVAVTFSQSRSQQLIFIHWYVKEEEEEDTNQWLFNHKKFQSQNIKKKEINQKVQDVRGKVKKKANSANSNEFPK